MKPYKERFLERSAGVFKRLLAFGVDLFVLNFIVVSPFAELIRQNTTGEFFAEVSGTMLLVVVMISMLAMAYFVLMEWYFKRTLGMMILKIEASGDINFWSAVVRHLYLVPMFPFSLFIFMDPIWLLFKGERLSEKLTKTKTVERIRMV